MCNRLDDHCLVTKNAGVSATLAVHLDVSASKKGESPQVVAYEEAFKYQKLEGPRTV